MAAPEKNVPKRPPTTTPAEERGWLATVLDAHPFPALAAETDTGRVLCANEAARRLGLPSADGQAHATDARGEQIEARRLVPHLLAQQACAEGEEIDWRAGDQSYCLRVFCRRLPVTDGRTPPTVLTFLDVTRQKAVEAELRGAVEARDEFFSVATHELKDPLFSLQLSIQLLQHAAEKQGDVPAHVRQHLEVGRRQAERLARLIDNLLDVSRITGRRLRLDLEAFDLRELARETVGRMQDKARAVGTTIEAADGDPVIGYFDRLKVEQILTNLLTNALKYGAGRPVVVRVTADDGTAVLEVEDQGPGIDPADHERIFRRFERASDGHKKSSLGLGLYIVRSLAEAHGGQASVRSEPGRGAAFTVTLPRKRLHQAEETGGGSHGPSNGE